MQQKFSDSVLRKALPKIHEIYDDMTVEELQSLTFERMPHDIQQAIENAQAEWNLENKIYPVSSGTKSSDGKTCNYCKQELIVKQIERINFETTIKETVLSCPNPKGGIACEMTSKANQFDTQLEEDKKKMESAESIYKLNTRNYEIKNARHIYEINKNERLVTAPNNQFTELNFSMETIHQFDSLKGEAKKLETRVICQHELEKTVDLENAKLKTNNDNTALFYHLVKIESIGRIGLIDTYGCGNCRAIFEGMKPDPEDKYYSIEMTDEEKQTKTDDVIAYQISYQRIDSAIEKEILKLLREFRQKGDSRFFKSAQVEEELHKLSFAWVVGRSRTFKNFVSQRLKKLAKTEILEVEGIAWEFGIHIEGNFHQYGNYLDDAKKLNQYRYYDPYAIFMTKQTREEYEKIRDERRTWKTQENRNQLHEIFVKVAKQLGLESTEITLANTTDGQINRVCSVKKK